MKIFCIFLFCIIACLYWSVTIGKLKSPWHTNPLLSLYDVPYRFLKLGDDSCGLVLYPDNNVEVIFTKAYDVKNQNITENEEVLMALALFMKQPGFLEMLVSEFRKIAMNKISTLTEDKNNENN